MLDRIVCGDVPPKHHIAHRGPDGALRYEECVTRTGFDGPYSILYHLRRPHAVTASPGNAALALRADPPTSSTTPLARRHFRTRNMPRSGAPAESRTPL